MCVCGWAGPSPGNTLQYGPRNSTVNNKNIHAVENLVMNDRQITLREVNVY